MPIRTHKREHDTKAGPSQIERLVATVERLEAAAWDSMNSEHGWAVERDLLRATVIQAPDFQYVKDTEGRFIAVNSAVAAYNGFANPADMIGKTDFDIDTPEHAEVLFTAEQDLFRSGRPLLDFEELFVSPAGRKLWFATSKVPLRNQRGDIIGLAGVTRDITARKQADVMREGQAQVLEMIAMDAPLVEVLDRLVRLLETQLHAVSGSILLLDADGVHLRPIAGPGLPEAYSRALDGVAIGPSVGSCGTAAYRRAAVIVADILTDPLWTNFRDLATLHGLRSCWSTPILSHQGVVLGTFALYSAEVRWPTDE